MAVYYISDWSLLDLSCSLTAAEVRTPKKLAAKAREGGAAAAHGDSDDGRTSVDPWVDSTEKRASEKKKKTKKKGGFSPEPTTAPTATRLKSVASSLGCAVDVNSRDTAAVPARKLTGGGVTKIIV